MISKLQIEQLLVENGFMIPDPSRRPDISDPRSFLHLAKNAQGVYVGDFLEKEGFMHEVKTDDLNGEEFSFHVYKKEDGGITFRDLPELWKNELSSRQPGDYSTQFTFL